MAPYYPHYFPTVAQANASSEPTVLTIVQSGEANETFWHPNSVASSYMTPMKGTFLIKTPLQ